METLFANSSKDSNHFYLVFDKKKKKRVNESKDKREKKIKNEKKSIDLLMQVEKNLFH